MNISFWPFLWFGLPGRLLMLGNLVPLTKGVNVLEISVGIVFLSGQVLLSKKVHSRTAFVRNAGAGVRDDSTILISHSDLCCAHTHTYTSLIHGLLPRENHHPSLATRDWVGLFAYK